MQYILDKLKLNVKEPTSLFERVQLAKDLDLKTKVQYTKDVTKHYSENYNLLLFDLFKGFDYSKEVVDPFGGRGDLYFTLGRFSNTIMYDIKPEHPSIIQQDTLLSPLDYTNKYVVTNPPYLARNKNTDKAVYSLYNTDDLYKASIKSIIKGNALGGCLIVPMNFLTDENTAELRKEFFSKYHINNLNIFTMQMFEYTKYNTCSFNFFLGEQSSAINTIIFSNEKVEQIEIRLDKQYNYRLFGEFYQFKPTKEITRYTDLKQIPSNILVHCIDGAKGKNLIRAEYTEQIELGKKSDRANFICCFEKVLTKEQQLKVIDLFNEFITENRKKYYNLIFSNYREDNRKRISFETAYSILKKCVDNL